MYTKEDRMKAVTLFIKYNQNEGKVISELGYPSPNALRYWYREYIEHGDLHDRVEHKERYTKQQIENAVTYYITHDTTISQTCRAMGYPCRPLLRRWIKKLHPEVMSQRKAACKTRRHRVYYSQKQKVTAVRMNTEEHIPIYKIAAEYGVSKATISKWKHDILCRNGSIAMHEAKEEKHVIQFNMNSNEDELTNNRETLLSELASLKKEVYRLRMERDALEKAAELLKKAEGIKLTEISNLEKAGVIDALKTHYRLKDLLDLFRMSKSSYCYSHNASHKADKYHILRGEIQRVFSNSNHRYGYRRVRAELNRDGLKISEKVIRRLMKESHMTVFQVKHKKYSSYRGEISPEVANLVQRDFHADRPNERWLTDITEFSLPSGKVYLSPIIDCFDGYVVSWTHGTSPSAGLVNEMLDQAILSLGENERPIIHSDRGCHYRWPDWIKRTNQAGLIRSMSRKGCSPDNSACEGFFGRLKIEMFYGRSWQGVTTDQFSDMLDEYITWYNSKRIKLSLGGLSPAEYRRNLGY